MPKTTTRSRSQRKTHVRRSAGTTRSRGSKAPSGARRAGAGRPKPQPRVDRNQLVRLILQGVETERGGIQVYETAIRCAQNADLRKEWEKYLDQTRNHERILTNVCQVFGIDPDQDTPDRRIVALIGQSFVTAMEKALESGDANGAQVVAAECVTLAETKDHLNWELIGSCAKAWREEGGRTLREAHDEVEDEEDEHLYHTMGWCRELWLESLGLDAQLPPPEEKRKVKTLAGEARVVRERKAKTAPRRR